MLLGAHGMRLTVSILMEKLTDIPIRSFFKPQVPFVIRIKAQEKKNKIFKPHVPIRCLTQNLKGYILWLIL
jgi:hypothetical protein